MQFRCLWINKLQVLIKILLLRAVKLFEAGTTKGEVCREGPEEVEDLLQHGPLPPLGVAAHQEVPEPVPVIANPPGIFQFNIANIN